LVDTIIDLQIDEAPLIVRNQNNYNFNNNYDKCMSCSQYIRDSEDPNASLFSSGLENSKSNKTLNTNTFQFQKFNNTTLKCGTGGYSRYLENLPENSKGIHEELVVKKDTSNSVLADIINNRNNTLYKITSNHNSKSNIFNSGSKKQQTSYISRIANNLSNNENTESHIALTDRNINYKEKSEKSGKSDNEISSKSIIPDISKDKIEKNIKEYLNTELNLELGKTIFKPSSLLGKADKAYNKNSKSTKKLIFK